MTVTGQVSVGGVAGTPVNLLYVVDVSGSTGFFSNLDCDGDGNSGQPGDDFNGDGALGDVLDCEISGVLALNESLFGTVNVDGGLVPFGSFAAVADVGPAAGQQDFTSPLDADANTNSVPDLEEVARSLDQGSVSQFTLFNVSTGTNFNNAIASINSAFSAQPVGEQNIAFFLSDGVGALSTGAGLPLDLAATAGTVINTFSVGPGATGCAVGAGLRTIADTTGGTCTEVLDPTDLSSELPGLTPALLDRVEVNGAVVPTDALGNFQTEETCPSPNEPDFTITATGYAADPDGTTISADVQLVCKPLNEPPDCSQATPSVATIWPPNHKFVPVNVQGVTDPDGDPVVITIDSIFQDEPVDTFGDGKFVPDGQGVGTDTAEVRAERSGTKKVPGNGRVYHIGYMADDGQGGSCSGNVAVAVPHDQNAAPVDGGALFDSTAP